MPLIGTTRLFLSIISLLSLLIIPASISARRHRHFRGHERHFSRQNLEEIPEEKLAEKPKHQQRRAPRIICVHGSPVGGRCICEQGWAGINCQSEMYCGTFERTPNGSCTQCQPNFGGDRCELPECQNGGQPMQNEQRCECPKPYSGNFCEELLTKNVYYFYNSKVATVGPLGLLAVIPMIGVYVLCERFARKRQVRRIEKTWNEQQMDGHGHVNPQHIELLLKEKA